MSRITGSGMPVGKLGLHTLDIKGSKTNSCLIWNKSTFLSRGTREFILSYRQEFLVNRGYLVPEDWDLAYNIRLGPVFSPINDLGEVAGEEAGMKAWYPPEHFSEETSDSTLCVGMTDRSDNDIDFEELDVGTIPTFSTVTLGKDALKGAKFDGTNDTMSHTVANKFDWATDDFLMALVLDIGADENEGAGYICTTNTKANLALLKNTNGSFSPSFKLEFWSGGTKWLDSNEVASFSSGLTANEIYIVIIGRINGIPIMNINGEEAVGSFMGGDSTSIGVASKKFTFGSTVAAGSHAAFTMYEFLAINREKEAGSFSDDYIDNIEGYLAHKYNLTGDLPVGHAYKTQPPRMNPFS